MLLRGKYRMGIRQPVMLVTLMTGSVILTFVPPTKIPPRAPLGPSVVLIDGMPFSGMAFVLQKSAAVRRETCKR